MLLTTLPRDTLLNPLTTVTGIVERRHTLPILSNVLVTKVGSNLSFLATDLEIQIECATVADNGNDFTLTVSAKKMLDILKAVSPSANVSVEQDDQRLTIKSGKSKFNVHSLPAGDFPTLTLEAEVRAEFSMSQKVLKDLISQVQYAMGHQDIRYYLNGLLMITQGHTIKLVTTDGHRLAFVQSEISSDIEKNDSIIPRKTVLELFKLLQNTDDEVHIQIRKSQISFNFNGIHLHSKLIDGKFPDYNRVIPTTNQKIVPLNREQLLHALQRAAILSNEKFRGVRLLLENGLLKIICSNSEQEEAEEELEIVYDAEKLDVGFNINYLLDMLTNIDVQDLVFSFGDHATSSTLITIPDNTNFSYVVMPMRI